MNKKNNIITFSLVILLWMTTFVTVYANSQIHSLYNSDFIKIEQMDGVSYEILEETKETINATQRYFRMNFEISLGIPVLIVLTPDQSTYRDELIRRFGYSQSRAEDLSYNTAGLAFRNVIIVNAGSSSTPLGRSFIIIHELTHSYQWQLTGNPTHAVNWIVEGMADTVAAQVSDQEGYYRLDNYKRNLENKLSMTANKPSLSELILRNDWQGCLYKYGYHSTYQTAGYATLLLTERFGARRVMNYFADLGHGANSETAFQNSFGIPLSDFIGDYERVLR